jgi:hypothetical protein
MIAPERAPHRSFFRRKGIGGLVNNLNPVNAVKNVSNGFKEGGVSGFLDASSAAAGVGSEMAPSVVIGYTKATIDPGYSYGYDPTQWAGAQNPLTMKKTLLGAATGSPTSLF